MGFKPRKQPELACKHDDCVAQPHVFGYCYAHAERSAMITTIVDLKAQLHKTNTRIGMLHARQDGTRLGRPALNLPSSKTVCALRAAGYTWATAAAELKCTVWAVRQAAKNAMTD